MKNLREFKNDEQGVFLLVIGIALFFVIGIVALSINMNNVQAGYAKNQGASDAAALATAEWIMKAKIDKILDPAYTGGRWVDWRPTPEETQAFAKEIFSSNLGLDSGAYSLESDAKFRVVFDDTRDEVFISSCVNVKPLDIAVAIGKDRESEVCAQSNASFLVERGLRDVEIALSLDYTGSMRNAGKLDGLVGAVNVILDKYFVDARENNIYISITPFSSFVSMAPYHEDLIDADGGSGQAYMAHSFTRQSFQGHNPLTLIDGKNFIKLAPLEKMFTDPANPKLTYPAAVRNKAEIISRWPAFNVQPLTSDVDLLKNYIQAFEDTVHHSMIPPSGGFRSYTSYEQGAVFPTAHPTLDSIGGTSGISGITTAWLTIAPAWKGKWNRASLFESANLIHPDHNDPDPDVGNYFPSQGAASISKRVYTPIDRTELPSDSGENLKFLIHITDGGDNNTQYDTVSGVTGDKEFHNKVCDLIKADKDGDGNSDVEIYVIVYGTTGQDYHRECATDSTTHYFTNVSPAELEERLSTIFERISSRATRVKLTK